MDYKEICPYFEEDYVRIKGQKRLVCKYYNIDKVGLCKHPDKKVCVVFFKKRGIKNPMIEKLIEEFDLSFI